MNEAPIICPYSCTYSCKKVLFSFLVQITFRRMLLFTTIIPAPLTVIPVRCKFLFYDLQTSNEIHYYIPQTGRKAAVSHIWIPTIFSAETPVKTLRVYQLTLGAFGPMEQAPFVASLSSCFVHLLLIDCIRPIECWVLDSFYLNDFLRAGLAELIADFRVLESILYRIQLEQIYSFLLPVGIGWLRDPIIWKFDICLEEKYKKFLI